MLIVILVLLANNANKQHINGMQQQKFAIDYAIIIHNIITLLVKHANNVIFKIALHAIKLINVQLVLLVIS